MWRWDQQEPFGVNVPDENPSGLGTFEFPLRFPGQYFDRETNQHYNGFRDLDPILDRYGRADPLGVLTTQGPTSTTKLNHLYVYANANPLSSTDPSGLLSPLQHAGIFLEAFGGTGFSDAFAWQVAREAVIYQLSDAVVHTPRARMGIACSPRQTRSWTQRIQGVRRVAKIRDNLSHDIDDWFPSQENRAAAVAESRRLIQQEHQLRLTTRAQSSTPITSCASWLLLRSSVRRCPQMHLAVHRGCDELPEAKRRCLSNPSGCTTTGDLRDSIDARTCR